MDQDGEPCITDFGLARPLDAASSLTVTGQMLGTPAFMAPEQADVRRTPGPAVDIYSLGALLFHLLTGRPPFVGGTVAELLRHVAEQEPVSPAVIHPAVPRDLAGVCFKALAKEPSGRYRSASALAEDLRRFLRGEATEAQPPGPAIRILRWCRREPQLATAIAMVLLLIGGALVTTTWLWRRAAEASVERLEQLWKSSLLEARAHRISVRPGQRLRALEVIQRAAKYRASEELRNEAIAALLLPDLGDTLVWHPVRYGHWPIAFNEDLSVRAPWVRNGRVRVHDTSNRAVLSEFPGLGGALELDAVQSGWAPAGSAVSVWGVGCVGLEAGRVGASDHG